MGIDLSYMGDDLENISGKILCIDDSEHSIILYREILEDYNFTVEGITDPEFVKEKCLEFDPEIIILDLMMPKKDGLSILRELKSDPVTRNLQVVVVTARSEPDYLKKAFELGAFDYIKKPFNSIELVMRIKSALKLKRSLDRYRSIQEQLEQTNVRLLNEKIRLKNEYMKLRKKLAEFSAKTEQPDDHTAPQNKLEKGTLYLYYERRPIQSLNDFVAYVKNRYLGLLITRSFPQNIKEKYSLKTTPIFWLNTLVKGIENNAISPQQLQEILYLVRNFMETGVNDEADYGKIVMIDGLEQLIVYNGFNTVIRLVGTLYDICKYYNVIILMSINPGILNPREKALLGKECTVIDLVETPGTYTAE